MPNKFEEILTRFFSHSNSTDFSFVQIGAYDGLTNDPIYPFVKHYHWKGILIEPQWEAYQRLKENYRDQKHLIFLNIAIAEQDGFQDFYRIRDGVSGLPDWSKQIASFRLDVITKHKDGVPEYGITETIPNIEDLIEVERVKCITFNSLLDRYRLQQIDLLLIDTEGYDYNIIKGIDFKRIKPSIIYYEHMHLSKEDREECAQYLKKIGYEVIVDYADTIALIMDNRYLHVEIEPTNICNTRCLHCPHESLSRPYGKMDWDTYQIVMDKTMAYTPNFSVEYAGMGEPLLNPEVYNFIKYVSGMGSTSLTTNASALTDKNIQKLIDAGLSRLTISFNGEAKAVYELMMGGLDFERAQKNIRRAIDIINGSNTEIIANVSVTRQTQGRLKDIKKYLNDAGIQTIIFSKCHNRGGFLKGNLVCNTPMPPTDSYRCDIYKNTLFVTWTGQVLSCCHDLAGNNILGDFRIDEVKPILEEKQKVITKGVSFDICKSCNDLYRFMDDQSLEGFVIADWIYNLYATKDEDKLSTITPLTRWLFEIYKQESALDKFIARMYAQINETNQSLQQMKPRFQDKEREIQSLIQEVEALKTAINGIHSTRSWRFLEGMQKVRRFFIPIGSLRETFYKKLLGRIFG
jgi:FkbM family methyltransferase